VQSSGTHRCYAAGAWTLDGRFAFGLGAALAIAMYDFLGYYQVCYLGDEVAEPARTLPRSILISVAAVALLYLTMNAGILGVIPWREVIASEHIASDLMARVHGPTAARVVTGMILWTGTAATFAGVLSYSRIPYAAARSGTSSAPWPPPTRPATSPIVRCSSSVGCRR
jgi:amino acid transporter